MPPMTPNEPAAGDWRKTDPFMQKHRGGSGNVWISYLYNTETGEDGPRAVFSCDEAIDAWNDRLDREGKYPEDAGWVLLSVPYVVDEPDFGNVPKGQQQ